MINKEQDEDQINDIVHMLDEFSDTDNKRVRIDTSEKLREGETKRTDILSKYDKTDPFVADIASIPKSKGKRRSGNGSSFNFDFLNISK